MEYVPVAIYARKVDDTLCYINRRAHEIFPDEREYVAKDDFYGQREKNIFKEGKVLEFPEEWYTTLRGDKILLHLIKAPVFDKEGNPFMVLTVAEDITEKKQQEKAIVDAKNFLQAVIDQLPLSLSVKNYDGKYILWNKKSEDLFGV
ncbi:MAG: PAS domain S-box protein, partial [Elusimicrobiaceae bacterium]|nr:PAS domain S-box protein [Elusimicrobiaceae bacterium]